MKLRLLKLSRFLVLIFSVLASVNAAADDSYSFGSSRREEPASAAAPAADSAQTENDDRYYDPAKTRLELSSGSQAANQEAADKGKSPDHINVNGHFGTEYRRGESPWSKPGRHSQELAAQRSANGGMGMGPGMGPGMGMVGPLGNLGMAINKMQMRNAGIEGIVNGIGKMLPEPEPIPQGPIVPPATQAEGAARGR